jgi:hypothetical protein
MGYTRKSHKHYIEKTNPPLCEQCNTPETINHILLHCTKYSTERNTSGININYRNGSEEETLRLLLFLEETKLLDEG